MVLPAACAGVDIWHFHRSCRGRPRGPLLDTVLNDTAGPRGMIVDPHVEIWDKDGRRLLGLVRCICAPERVRRFRRSAANRVRVRIRPVPGPSVPVHGGAGGGSAAGAGLCASAPDEARRLTARPLRGLVSAGYLQACRARSSMSCSLGGRSISPLL